MNQTICFHGGRVFASDHLIGNGSVVVADGRIVAIGRQAEVTLPADAAVVDVSGLRVTPGLIDLHIHGLAGHDLAKGHRDAVSAALAKYGVTSYLAALAAAPLEETVEAIERLARAAEPLSAVEDARGARLAGIYLEGPFISPHRAGFLSAEAFRSPSIAEVNQLLQAGRGLVRVVAVAPELPGALELISWLSSEGVIVAAGHSDATYEQMLAAIEKGIRQASHTFNAMRPYHHREPGIVGAVLDREEITAEVIADGDHLHPAAVRLLLRVKRPERLCLVSDAAPFAGLPQGVYERLGRRVLVDGTMAKAEDGTLAGSVTPLNAALRKLMEFTGLPLEAVLPTASRTPARVLSLPAGDLAVGQPADIAVFDDELRCYLTMVGGRMAYRAS